MVSRADIVVEVSMTLEQAIEVKRVLGKEPYASPTQPTYEALQSRLAQAESLLAANL